MNASLTPAIVIRRSQVSGEQRTSDTLVSATDMRRTAMELKEALYAAQRDRGRGPWSDADPVVLINGAAVGRLRRNEAIEELVGHVLDRIFPGA